MGTARRPEVVVITGAAAGGRERRSSTWSAAPRSARMEKCGRMINVTSIDKRLAAPHGMVEGT